MKFCPKCGKPLDNEELKFCPNCGSALEYDEQIKEEPLQQNAKKPQKKGNTKFVIIGLVFVLACVCGYFGYSKYHEIQQENKRIAQEQALVEQQAKAEQERKEKEEQAKKEQKAQAEERQERLASKANVKDTFIFGMFQSNKYLPYSSLAGMKLTDAKNKFNLYQVEGREYYENDIVSEANLSTDGKIKNFSIYFNEPINSEALLSAVSSLPFMTWNKEKGYFSETGIISETGDKIQIFYYVDTNTLSIDHALIVKVE